MVSIARAIPHDWKAELKFKNRQLQDWYRGDSRQFAQPGNPSDDGWLPQLQISQELKPSPYSDNKWVNLAIALQKIEPVVIHPNQIFSFWQAVGAPTKKNGYQVGRSLMNGQLAPVFGGGLCQLSGLIYLLALHTDFGILERHAHSKDIYTDETRFAPLGGDATIVYGYKDLRLKNQTTTDLRFQFELFKTHITATIMALQPIPIYEVKFLLEETENSVQVETQRYRANGTEAQLCNMTNYQR